MDEEYIKIIKSLENRITELEKLMLYLVQNYEALMAERKPEGEPQQTLPPKSVVKGLKETFGDENVKVEGAK